MESVQIDRYGDAGCLSLRTLDEPALGPAEVRLRVRACSVNAADLHMLHGTPWPLKLAMGWSRPHRIRGFGADVAGVVEAVGASITRLRIGDEVFGDLSGCGFGAAASSVTAPESVLVHKPAGVSFEAAAATPMAAATAQKGLCDVGGLAAGQRLLVVGASGGVGSFAVQLGRSLGAEVVAVARAEKHAALAPLGATQLATPEALAAGRLGAFDVVLDAAAYGSPFAYRRDLVPGGIYVLAGGSFASIVNVGLFGGLAGLLSGRRFRSYLSTPTREVLEHLASLLEAGSLRPLIDRVVPLSDVTAAVAAVERREITGKLVLTLPA